VGGQTNKGAGRKANAVCSSVCSQRRTKRSELAATGEATATAKATNLLDRQELVQQVSAAKDRLLDKLRVDYGEFFDPIFADSSATTGYRPCVPSTPEGISLERLKRKLMIKVLSMQLALDSKDADFHGCDCSGGKDTALRKDAMDSLDPEDPSVVFEGIDNDDDFFEKYVWVTGGHSAAAGHGNLYNETYTKYMENDLKDVFGSIGIEFEGRNYAMGGTSSATSVSMCWKEIFGEDVDFFSWDYGMTDGRSVSSMFHYIYRGALSATRPAVMAIHTAGRSGKSRLAAFETLEEMGLATFHAEEGYMKAMRDNFPDSAVLSTENLDALPEYVKNYRCEGQFEKGEPFCGKDKYTKWGCSPRLKQVSWHPGFKDHALVGHGLALFLMETLLGTVRDLSELEAEAIPQLLSQLQEEEIDLHSNFTTAELPASYQKLFDLKKLKVSDTEPKIDPSLFFKGSSMCHTARLPSQIRYHGILTDTDKVGQPAPVGEETYHVGVNKEDAKKTATKNQEMRLAYAINKERETKCTGVTVKPDYPDVFFTHSKDDWTKLIFPNDAEKRFYGYDSKQFEGILILHFRKCDWGKCPTGFLQPEDFPKKAWEMKINNQRVTKVTPVFEVDDAVIIEHENGIRFAPDSNGQYTIEIKVNVDESYVEITDFVVH